MRKFFWVLNFLFVFYLFLLGIDGLIIALTQYRPSFFLTKHLSGHSLKALLITLILLIYNLRGVISKEWKLLIPSFLYLFHSLFIPVLWSSSFKFMIFTDVLMSQNNPSLLLTKIPWFKSYLIVSSLVFILASLYVFYYLIKKWNADLQRTSFKRYIAKIFIMMVLGLTILTPYTKYMTQNLVSSFSGGFLKTDLKSLQSIEKIYQYQKGTIHLIPMMHIAKKDFYKQILEDYKNKEVLIIEEGVSDKDKLLEKRPSYKKIAGLLGLSNQKDAFKTPEGAKMIIKNGDTDINTFSTDSIKLLNLMFLAMDSIDSNSPKNIQLYASLDKELNKDGNMQNLFIDILDKRDEHLWGQIKEHMERSTQQNQTIIIPWGALHLPYIQRKLKELSVKQINERTRTMVSLDSIFQLFKRQMGEEH